MQNLELRSLSRNIAGTLSRQIVAVILGLAVTVIIARSYGPKGNGGFSLALLLPSLLSTFFRLGVPSANVYYLGSGQISARQLLNANLRIFVILGTLGVGIGTVILLWKSEVFFPGIDSAILWIALTIFPIDLLNGYLQSVFLGLQQFRRYNLLAITQSITVLVLVTALTLLGNQKLSLLVSVQVVAQVFILALTIKWLKPLVEQKDTRPPKDFIKKTLSYGMRVHVTHILTFINYKVDIFLTNFFLGPAAVGIYVIGVALAEKIWLLSQAVSTVLLPRLSQLSSEEEKRKQLTPLVARWVLLVTLVGAILVASLAKFIILLMFGSDYLDALLPIWILLPGIVLTSASRVFANDLAARGRPELNMYTSAFVVIVNILGNLILIPPYGISGAAAATTIAYVLNMVLRLIIYSHFTGTNWIDSIFVSFRDVKLLWEVIRKL